MVWERRVLIEGKSYIAVVSDETQALLAAQAAGRAVVGVVNGILEKGSLEMNGRCSAEGREWEMKGVPHLVPSWEAVSEELLELVQRRFLGLPWIIEETERLVIREFVREDALCIPQEECGEEEGIFCCPDTLERYIQNQYGFYEYGTWALEHKNTGTLVGMAGVSNPRLPADMEQYLEKLERSGKERLRDSFVWLELGYHIFRPWRGMGYGGEAAAAVMNYSHEVLEARLCALINRDNEASCRLAQRLGMKAAAGEGRLGVQREGLLYLE